MLNSLSVPYYASLDPQNRILEGGERSRRDIEWWGDRGSVLGETNCYSYCTLCIFTQSPEKGSNLINPQPYPPHPLVLLPRGPVGTPPPAGDPQPPRGPRASRPLPPGASSRARLSRPRPLPWLPPLFLSVGPPRQCPPHHRAVAVSDDTSACACVIAPAVETERVT